MILFQHTPPPDKTGWLLQPDANEGVVQKPQQRPENKAVNNEEWKTE